MAFCPSCGTPSQTAGAQFCGTCGGSLGAPAQMPAAPVQPDPMTWAGAPQPSWGAPPPPGAQPSWGAPPVPPYGYPGQPAWAGAQPKLPRPAGMVPIVVLALILSALEILVAVVLIGLSSSADSVYRGAGGIISAIGFVYLILGVATIVFGLGAWQLKGWAWIFGIVLGIIYLLFGGLGLIGSASSSSSGGALVILIVLVVYWAAVLFWLAQSATKRAFGQ